jgi:hypothetical protein
MLGNPVHKVHFVDMGGFCFESAVYPGITHSYRLLLAVCTFSDSRRATSVRI